MDGSTDRSLLQGAWERTGRRRGRLTGSACPSAFSAPRAEQQRTDGQDEQHQQQSEMKLPTRRLVSCTRRHRRLASSCRTWAHPGCHSARPRRLAGLPNALPARAAHGGPDPTARAVESTRQSPAKPCSDAERKRTAGRTTESDGLSGHDTESGVACVHRVGIHHPGHHLRVGTHVRCRDAPRAKLGWRAAARSPRGDFEFAARRGRAAGQRGCRGAGVARRTTRKRHAGAHLYHTGNRRPWADPGEPRRT